MANKHELLTVAELEQHQFTPEIMAQLNSCEATVDAKPKILDFGCGRGRSVLHLLRAGYDAVGADCDEQVLEKGRPCFDALGFDCQRRLLHLNRLAELPDCVFDFVFSEQVLEHAVNLDEVASLTFRLLRPGGLAVHCLPGQRCLMEPHVRVPLVHWFPKAWPIHLWIRMMMMLSFGPKPPWPAIRAQSPAAQAFAYSEYLREKTHYRSTAEICRSFRFAGFETAHALQSAPPRWLRWICVNGFPDHGVVIHCRRPP